MVVCRFATLYACRNITDFRLVRFQFMARQTERTKYEVPSEFYDFARRFYTECLQNHGSLYLEGEDLWSPQNIDIALNAITGENAEEDSSQGFYQKLGKQLPRVPETNNQRAIAARLFVEAIHVHYAYNFQLSISARNEAMSSLYEYAQYTPEQRERAETSVLLGQGVGSTGQNSQKIYGSVLVLLMTAKNWNHYDGDPDSAEACWNFIDQIVDTNRTIGNQDKSAYLAVPHVIFPDYAEDSSVLDHKQRILTSFRNIWPASTSDESFEAHNQSADDSEIGSQLDQNLYELRTMLREQGVLGSRPNLSFYEPELAPVWGHSASEGPSQLQEEMLNALQIKKQIILHGPPGTSKTFSAQSIATALLKQDAVMAYRDKVTRSAEESLSLIREISSTADTPKIDRLQFHPNYTYEDFIGGWQLDNGSTQFLPGYLPRLCEQVAKTERAHVLILDEINRVDLSRVMGEAFSLLDRKMDGSPNRVKLPVPVFVDGEAIEPTLELPENLYIIGTMNELDQQVELMDYAMRRRFLWFRLGFDPEVLRSFLYEASDELQKMVNRPYHRFDVPRYKIDVDTYVDAAQELNTAIHTHPDLGQEFEIGHTIFFEVLLHLKLALRGASSKMSYLYNKKSGHRSEAMDSVEAVWKHSIQPLLSAYLRMKPEQSKTVLNELHSIFLLKAPRD